MPTRQRRIDIRVSPAEKKRIGELAHQNGMTVTDLLLTSMRHDVAAERLTPEYIELLAGLRIELRRQGNNINQIAHRLNALKGSVEPDLLRSLFDKFIDDETQRRLTLETVEKEIMRLSHHGIS